MSGFSTAASLEEQRLSEESTRKTYAPTSGNPPDYSSADPSSSVPRTFTNNASDTERLAAFRAREPKILEQLQELKALREAAKKTAEERREWSMGCKLFFVVLVGFIGLLRLIGAAVAKEPLNPNWVRFSTLFLFSFVIHVFLFYVSRLGFPEMPVQELSPVLYALLMSFAGMIVGTSCSPNSSGSAPAEWRTWLGDGLPCRMTRGQKRSLRFGGAAQRHRDYV